VAAKAPAAHASTPLAAPAQTSVPAVTQGTAESPAAAPQGPQHITIDDFAKVELRVAQILVAERVPKADKLLRLEVDLGYEKRQILAGIAQHYEPEKLIGRKIVIVANLAPRKMRGLESNGMLLAASLEGGAPVLAGFLEEVPLGARLK
jgi:methionyl-tRNA synthetase